MSIAQENEQHVVHRQFTMKQYLLVSPLLAVPAFKLFCGSLSSRRMLISYYAIQTLWILAQATMLATNSS